MLREHQISSLACLCPQFPSVSLPISLSHLTRSFLLCSLFYPLFLLPSLSLCSSLLFFTPVHFLFFSPPLSPFSRTFIRPVPGFIISSAKEKQKAIFAHCCRSGRAIGTKKVQRFPRTPPSVRHTHINTPNTPHQLVLLCLTQTSLLVQYYSKANAFILFNTIT